MIEPSRFAAQMAEHWAHRLTNVSSPALLLTWRKIAEAFNASIEDAAEPLPFGADPKWRVLNPATGTGKTQGLALYASMLPTEDHPGVLVVVRLKAQADDLATTINDLAGNHRRATYGYYTYTRPSGALCTLPTDTYEYKADGSPYRHTHQAWQLDSGYLTRGFTGLLQEVDVYDSTSGADVLKADIEALEIYVGISEIPTELDKNGRGICGAIVVSAPRPAGSR